MYRLYLLSVKRKSQEYNATVIPAILPRFWPTEIYKLATYCIFVNKDSGYSQLFLSSLNNCLKSLLFTV